MKSGFKRIFSRRSRRSRRLQWYTDGKNVFDQPVKNNLRANDNTPKTTAGQGYDYATVCLLDYPHVKENYNMIAIYLSKQQALDADAKAMQQINFTGNLYWPAVTTMFFINEEVK